MEVVGIHLLQPVELVGTRRPSAVARLDGEGRLVSLELAGDDRELLALVPEGAAAVAVDAPLAVPNREGRRDLERVLAWCDVPAFPVSLRRLEQLHGGARGVALAPGLVRGGRPAVEALPELVLRQLAWERERPPGAPALDLAEYRARWLGVRPPAYRPKGSGRARPAGLAPAWRLLAEAIDLGGWLPDPAPDDWRAIEDAARLDALCCAYAALRGRDPDASALVGTPERGQLVTPADANLRARLEATVARLRGEGAIAI